MGAEKNDDLVLTSYVHLFVAASHEFLELIQLSTKVNFAGTRFWGRK
jgi:hypothetical protein